MPNTFKSNSKLRARVVYIVHKLMGHEFVGFGITGKKFPLYHVYWA